MHFPIEDAMMIVVKQLIDEDAKRVFARKIQEITDDPSWMRTGRDAGA